MSDRVQGIKSIPIGEDRIIIRDTEDSNRLKEATLNSIPGGSVGGGIVEISGSINISSSNVNVYRGKEIVSTISGYALIDIINTNVYGLGELVYITNSNVSTEDIIFRQLGGIVLGEDRVAPGESKVWQYTSKGVWHNLEDLAEEAYASSGTSSSLFNLVPIVSSDSPYNAAYFDEIHASLSVSDITVIVPEGTSDYEEIRIASLYLIGSNKLILQSTSGFEVFLPDGTTIQDTEIHITTNSTYTFKWTGSRWRYTLGG